ncbi:GGDEF domain-containing protein [Methylorubrum extorquens]|uniref:GGDEF domain-containing protein n=1 Tax=Methylorubrum extorquens TaxID=408 RepID=UPI000158FC5E|nr:GGDEF domain-containing protein [Methylorubrum extorquens]ABY30088.1 diguanylate cyclase [Methylorubrum extorquens PA1]KQP93503.1 diguanylate cyclase [Methylobacterium sp. Leaf119]WIU41397.1 GGDEF domain-containing protein [Methylorubrum extorquens]
MSLVAMELGTVNQRQASGPGKRRLSVQIGLVSLMVTTALSGFFFTNAHQQALIDLREGGRQMRIAQEALMDAESYVLNKALGTGDGQFGAFNRALEALHSRRTAQLALLTPFIGRSDGNATAGGILESLEASWTEVLELARSGRLTEAQALLRERHSAAQVGRIRSAFDAFLTDWNAHFAVHETRIEIGKLFVLLSQLLIGGVMVFAFRSAARDAQARQAAITQVEASRKQVGHLFGMTDMLQSAADHHDANAVLRATAGELIAGFGGALYVFNNSRDRLVLSTSWACSDGASLPEAIMVGQCWAMKRGKPHINHRGAKALCCEHHVSGMAALEIPMAARGENLGLLQIFAEGTDAETRLAAMLPLSSALGDAMSLALSNIALREKLRNQALRDPLTGLYNRRYMEDSLERYVRLAEREGRKVSVIMIDLDHFKRLNDEHGHAIGDAVLCEAAAAIVGALRETDVACRYGGEEMIVFLPDCDLEDAAAKAEQIRGRIESLSGTHGAKVSASLGVASVPSTSGTSAELIRAADTALYRAKHNGRNQVAVAPLRQGWRSRSEAAPDEPVLLPIAAE